MRDESPESACRAPGTGGREEKVSAPRSSQSGWGRGQVGETRASTHTHTRSTHRGEGAVPWQGQGVESSGRLPRWVALKSLYQKGKGDAQAGGELCAGLKGPAE